MILLSCSGCCRKDCITPKAGTHRSSETAAPLKPKYSHRPKRNPHTVRAKFALGNFLRFFAPKVPYRNERPDDSHRTSLINLYAAITKEYQRQLSSKRSAITVGDKVSNISDPCFNQFHIIYQCTNRTPILQQHYGLPENPIAVIPKYVIKDTLILDAFMNHRLSHPHRFE